MGNESTSSFIYFKSDISAWYHNDQYQSKFDWGREKLNVGYKCILLEGTEPQKKVTKSKVLTRKVELVNTKIGHTWKLLSTPGVQGWQLDIDHKWNTNWRLSVVINNRKGYSRSVCNNLKLGDILGAENESEFVFPSPKTGPIDVSKSQFKVSNINAVPISTLAELCQ